MTGYAVLVDLDGTLVDTAPDLVAVLNHLLRQDGRRLLPYAQARNEVSNGAIGLIRRAYGDDLDATESERLRSRFIDAYAAGICINSRLFIELENFNSVDGDFFPAWGIVTNKPAPLTLALLAALGIADAPHCIVSGDTLPQRKPHPAPLRHAAELLGVAADRCIYVGDAQRDIVAGKAAGMKTAVAAYGYISPADDPLAWGADAMISRTGEFRPVLQRLWAEISGECSG